MRTENPPWVGVVPSAKTSHSYHPHLFAEAIQLIVSVCVCVCACVCVCVRSCVRARACACVSLYH
jgi:hypothetical protein